MLNTHIIPELHEIDFDAIIKKWIANLAARRGVFKDSDGNSDEHISKDVRRHLEKKSSTFCTNKEQTSAAALRRA